jgi:hypothetical protein
MPNGYQGPETEWNRLEAPLRDIDPPIEAFAKRHNMALTRNYHSWPERSLRWGGDPERVIQVYLDDADRLTWSLWLCASQDRGHQRFWKKQFLRRNVQMTEIRPVIVELIEEALRIVNSWRVEDLEFATTLVR